MVTPTTPEGVDSDSGDSAGSGRDSGDSVRPG